MTSSAPIPVEADDVVPTRLVERVRTPLVQLNLLGIVLVAIAIVPSRVGPVTAPALALGALALTAWAVWVLAPRGRVRTVAILAGAPIAALGAGLGSPSLIAPVIAALVVTVSETGRSWRAIAASMVVVVAALSIGAAVHGLPFEALLSLLAGAAFGLLGGYSRRQRTVAREEAQARFANALLAERETQRASLLEARSAAARDVHDVLAHSLGGLVLQLDAIEALLEHGRTEEAATRAAAARRLAGEGLTEARRAVAVLRDPEAAVRATVPDDVLAALLDEHRALGGTVEVRGDPSLRGVDDVHRGALVSALREALVNARRHAQGRAVRVTVRRDGATMMLRVENAMPPSVAPSVGGGHGLQGVRERFAALGDGSAATAGPEGDVFVVSLRAVLA